MEVIFIRHAQAKSNILPFEQGIVGSDLELTPDGILQAKAAAKKLGELSMEGIITPPSLIYTSPYHRTRETAGIIALELNLRVGDIPKTVTDFRLVEFQKADLHGETVLNAIAYESAIPESERFIHLYPNDKNVAPSENFFKMAHRMLSFIEEHEMNGEKSLVVVSHNHPIESAIGALRNLPVERWEDTPIANGALTRVVKNGDTWEADPNLHNFRPNIEE